MSNQHLPIIDDHGRPGSRSSRSSARTSRYHELRSFVSPDVHSPPPEPSLASGASTPRRYDRAHQRNRLLFNGGFKLAVTSTLCASCAAVLVHYWRLPYLSAAEVGTFNTLITAFPILIGTNVASSLRSSAKMLRWRILASRYRTLREFDLILSCAEQTNVLKLAWQSQRSHYWLIPTATQILCLVWLFLNLAGAILVALLGLTYALAPSATAILAGQGNVSVINTETTSVLYSNLNSYGVRSDVGELFSSGDASFAPVGYVESCAGNNCTGTWSYDFLNIQNRSDIGFGDIIVDGVSVPQTQFYSYPSGQSLRATVQCASFDVIPSQFDNFINVTYVVDGEEVIQQLYGQAAPDATTYIWDFSGDQDCGPRCASIYAFLAANSTEESLSRFYTCNSTVSPVNFLPSAKPNSEASYDEAIEIADVDAQSIAASIAYSYFPTGSILQSFALYQNNSPWALDLTSKDPTSADVADRIAHFSMAALAQADKEAGYTSSARTILPGLGPVVLSRLTVTWKYAATLLVLVPILQFIALLVVVAYANKAVVKDGSNLAIAKLLMPLVAKLGDRGCLLTGDEIVDVLADGDLRVAYNYSVRETLADDGTETMHIGLFEKKAGLTIERAFPEGWYDGAGDGAGEASHQAWGHKRRRVKVLPRSRRQVRMLKG